MHVEDMHSKPLEEDVSEVLIVVVFPPQPAFSAYSNLV